MSRLLRRMRAVGRRLSLRARLLLGLLLLATVGFAAADAASTLLLGRYLTDRIDRQLEGNQEVLARLEKATHTVVVPPPLVDQNAAKSQIRPLLNDFLVEYYDPDGQLIARYLGVVPDDARPVLPPMDLEHARVVAGQPFEVPAQNTFKPGTGFRVLVRLLPGDTGSVVIAYDVANRSAIMRQLVGLEVVFTLLVLAMLGLLGVGVVRVALRPLTNVEDTAVSIIAGADLSRRVPTHTAPSTEIGRLSATFNTMLVEIEKAFAQRSESESRLRRFVADASHELRTPLAGIRGLAQLHRQGAIHDPDDVASLFERIDAEGVRMSRLVEDLLLLAKLDERQPQRRERVDLLPVVAEALDSARIIAPDRPLRLTILSDAAVTPTVIGDQAQLHQVIANLLSNALAHTPAGTSVTVRLGYSDDRRALVEVVDHGPGLSAGDADRVFERFYRSDPARSRNHDLHTGAGLGLSIVAAIVTAHGGQVQYVPTPGGGATFRVLLPAIHP
jgi:two-component system, OmpR family, sensor kinase